MRAVGHLISTVREAIQHLRLAADSLESALDHIQDGEIEEARSSGGGRAGGSGSASSRHSDTVWTEVSSVILLLHTTRC